VVVVVVADAAIVGQALTIILCQFATLSIYVHCWRFGIFPLAKFGHFRQVNIAVVLLLLAIVAWPTAIAFFLCLLLAFSCCLCCSPEIC